MKKFIFSLILLFFNLLSYADFDYCKGGLCYPNCKIKVINEKLTTNMEQEINDFCKGKTVVDIKVLNSRAVIIYK